MQTPWIQASLNPNYFFSSVTRMAFHADLFPSPELLLLNFPVLPKMSFTIWGKSSSDSTIRKFIMLNPHCSPMLLLQFWEALLKSLFLMLLCKPIICLYHCTFWCIIETVIKNCFLFFRWCWSTKTRSGTNSDDAHQLHLFNFVPVKKSSVFINFGRTIEI